MAKRKPAAAVMVPLDAVHPWEGNPRDNAEAVAAVRASISRFGFAAPIVARKADGEIIAGHTRWLAARELGLTEVPVRYVDLSTAEARALNLADNRVGEIAMWDDDKLAAAMTGLQAEGTALDGLGFDEWEVDALVDPAGDDDDAPDPDAAWADEDEDAPEVEPLRPDVRTKLYMRDVPNTIWPSDNEWGVPLLDAEMCAVALDAPLTRWGSVNRYATMRGTWHFFTDDDRFAALWRNPTGVLNSGAVAVVEPNYTAVAGMARAEVLWTIYRKRWLAWWWQSHGLRVWADVNVGAEHQDLALLGVPKGWTAYATRLYSGEGLEAAADAVFGRCAERAGTRTGLLFLVYGGGQQVRELAQRRGWLWVAEESDAVRGRHTEAIAAHED